MAGCTDLPYRRIAREFGCEIAFCEMVKDRPVVEGNERTLKTYLATGDWDRPLGIQIVGRDPVLMAEAARRLEQIGAAVIDINLGCPVRKVVSEGCGSALLREPEQVGRILDAMVSAVRVPVTIKMRTGFDEGDDDRFLQVARIADRSGAAAITVHGRTRKQGFSGLTNFQAIRAVKEAVSIPVIGNGNLYSASDAEEMIRETNCDGVMVARGALGNPWIYREIASFLETGQIPTPPSIPERAAVLRRHFRYLREFYGDVLAFRIVRRVIHWFVRGTEGSASLRLQGNAVDSVASFEAVVESFESSRAKEEPHPA